MSSERRSHRGRPVRVPTVLAAVACLLAVSACGGGTKYGEGGGEASATPQKASQLTVMIGSSGPAETRAVQEATKRFADKTGTQVKVIPAQDLTQQLQQGLAGGNPPDVFYVSPDRFRLYVDAGSLYPYGDQIPDANDFYPALRKAFTYQDKLYCAPKDSGNAALVIDTDAWKAAGLTDADIPKDWDQLATVAAKLTTPKRAGLSFGREYNVVGTFMLQNGGFYVNPEETQVTVDTPQNLATLNYLLTNLKKGSFRFAEDLETGWSGEALGKGKAAMAIEGAWVEGALKSDWPNRHWRAVPLPAGPAGTDTTAFTNCWGIAEKSKGKQSAVDLVKYLVSPEEQQTFTKAFGPTPSRSSLADWYAQNFPQKAAFAAGIDKGRPQISLPGFQSVLTDFNTQLEKMGAGSITPEQALKTMQKNGEAALGKK